MKSVIVYQKHLPEFSHLFYDQPCQTTLRQFFISKLSASFSCDFPLKHMTIQICHRTIVLDVISGYCKIQTTYLSLPASPLVYDAVTLPSRICIY